MNKQYSILLAILLTCVLALRREHFKQYTVKKQLVLKRKSKLVAL